MSDSESEFTSSDEKLLGKRKREEEESVVSSCDEPECGMPCWLVTPGGEELPLVVDADDTVRVLRSRVKKVFGEFSTKRHILAYNGVVLKDLDEAVSELGFEGGDAKVELRYTPKYLAEDALKNKFKVSKTYKSLQDAVVKGKLDLVQALITSGLDPLQSFDDAESESEATDADADSNYDDIYLCAFSLASALGHLKMVKYLCTVCNPSTSDCTQAFCETLNRGATEAALYLASGPFPLSVKDIFEQSNLEGVTPRAKHEDFKRIFKSLMSKATYDLKAKGNAVAVLRSVISSGMDLKVVKWVVSRGASLRDTDKLGNIFDTNMPDGTGRAVVDYLLDEGVLPLDSGMEKMPMDLIDVTLLRRLVKLGCSPQNVNVYHAAARVGHIDVVKYLIEEAKINIDMMDDDGCTALQAVFEFHGEEANESASRIIEYLISKGISVGNVSWGNHTALDIAAEQTNISLMNTILKVLPKSTTPIQLTVDSWPEMSAASAPFYDLLLEHNFDYNCFDGQGDTILSALANVDSLEGSDDDDPLPLRKDFIKRFLKNGALVDKEADFCCGHSTVMTTIASCEDEYAIEMYEHFTKLGANPDVRQANGVTPAHIAATEAMLRHLVLLNQVSLKTKDCLGRTPLLYRMFRGTSESLVQGKLLDVVASRHKELDINAQDMHGNVAVFGCKTIADLKRFVSWGADTKVVNDLGMSLLSWAPSMEVVRYEIEELGLDPHHVDKNGVSIFMHLLLRWPEAALHEFIAEYDPNMRLADKDGNTIPMLFMRRGMWDRFKKFGKNYNLEKTTDVKGRTAYHYAMTLPRYSEDVNKILAMNLRDNDGMTPLMLYIKQKGEFPKCAMEKLSDRCMKTGATVLMQLIEHSWSDAEGSVDWAKIDMDDADNEGKTVFMYIALRCDTWTDVLADAVKKADINKQDKAGRTAAHYIAESSYYSLAAYLSFPHSARLDGYVVDNNGNTMLMQAVLSADGGSCTNFEAGEIAEKRWPGLMHKKNNDGMCPAHYPWATRENASEVMEVETDVVTAMKVYSSTDVGFDEAKWILDKVGVADVDGEGKTLLHHATVNKSEDVKALLIKGADPNAKDTYGRTPLFYCGDAEVVTLLKRYGANPNIIDRNGCTVVDQKQFVSDADQLESLYLMFPGTPVGNPSYAAQYASSDVYWYLMSQGVDHDYVLPKGAPKKEDRNGGDIEVIMMKVATGMPPPESFHLRALCHMFHNHRPGRRRKGATTLSFDGESI